MLRRHTPCWDGESAIVWVSSVRVSARLDMWRQYGPAGRVRLMWVASQQTLGVFTTCTAMYGSGAWTGPMGATTRTARHWTQSARRAEATAWCAAARGAAQVPTAALRAVRDSSLRSVTTPLASAPPCRRRPENADGVTVCCLAVVVPSSFMEAGPEGRLAADREVSRGR